MQLRAKQTAFVREYLICRNGTRAAIAAGYAEKSAKVTASRLLTKANVAAAIAEGEKKAEERAAATLDQVIAELARVAFSGMSKFVSVTPEGDPMIDLSACTPADLDLLSEITVEDYKEGRGENARDVRRIKVKPLDRMNALITLGKHLGLGNKTADDAQSGIIAALRDIASRNISTAPLRADISGDED
jgi:phage terminase small subunit